LSRGFVDYISMAKWPAVSSLVFVDEADEEVVLQDSAVDTSLLAQEILSTTVRVDSVDGSQEVVKFAHAAKPLGYAYIAATTDASKLNMFSVAETFGAQVDVGKPILHVRISSGRAIEVNRDRRALNSSDEPEFFITSARGSDTRNNVIVQASEHKVMEESPSERVKRVLFAHLNALLFAHAHFVTTGPTMGSANKKAVLRTAIERMIQRFERFQQLETSDKDAQFSDEMRLFAKANAGRIDELVAKLEELSEKWNQPTTSERAKGYFIGLYELTLKTTVETIVKTTMKGGP
jgi:hypothetical protein